MIKNRYCPDISSPPGETIIDMLRESGLTLEQFSKLLNVEVIQIKHLINGYLSITEPLAIKLAEILGSNEEFWLNREFNYRQSLLEESYGKSCKRLYGYLE